MEIRTTSLARTIRVVLGSAVGASALLSASVANAQQAAPQDKQLEEIYVTGSRIARRSDFESASPVVSLNKDLLDKAGYGNLQLSRSAGQHHILDPRQQPGLDR
jgi:hypothetical protein